MLIVHVCSLWYSHSVKVNYCFIVLGICYHFVKKETTMCGCIALCWTISVSNCVSIVYQVGINKGIILRCTAYQISRPPGSCVPVQRPNGHFQDMSYETLPL